MIYCPKCGTANRDGSRFCNECGQGLGTLTRVKCPECGVMNPVQHAFCSECGGRLLPPSAGPSASDAAPTIKGLSLPTVSPVSGDEDVPVIEEPADVDEDVPAWLRELGTRRTAQSEATAVGAGEGSDDVPDWLRELRSSLPNDQEEEWSEQSEVPEWLAGMRPSAGLEEQNQEPSSARAEEERVAEPLAEMPPSAEAEAEEPGELPEAEEGEVPEWQAELRPRDVDEPEPEPPPVDLGEEELPAAEEGVLPDWLAELRPPEFEELEPTAPAADREEEELPDWLAEMPVSAADEMEEPPGVPEAEGWVIPDWLAEPQPWEVEESEEELPPWLAELRIPDEDEEDAIPAAAVPGWLQDLQPAASAEPTSLADQEGEEGGLPDWLVPSEADQEETLARAEIPEWLLVLKPTELREKGEPQVPGPMVKQPTEETGLLAGLQGTLPVEMIIAQPRAVAELDVTQGPLERDAPQARLFAEIVGRQPQAESKIIVQPPQRRLLALMPRWIIYLALIAVVIVPLLLEEPLLPRNLGASLPVQNLFDEVESLEEGALVLVAFDYDPSTSDEMDVLAQVLLDHLMERQARIVAVSLFPAGPPLAQALLDELAAGRPDYVGAYGQRYMNLGYLPGQATAVRLLGQSLSVALPQDFQKTLLADLPLAASITGIQDFALLVDLAANEQSVRWWIEQAAMPYNVPLAGGVSASVVPLALPYHQTESRQLVGLVGGLPDAAAYAVLRGDEMQGGILAARLDALTGGHLVFILVLTIGTVVQLVRGSGGGR